MSTERSVRELREEVEDRLRTSSKGLTVPQLSHDMSLETWLVDALLTHMVAEGKVVTEKYEGQGLTFRLPEVCL